MKRILLAALLALAAAPLAADPASDTAAYQSALVFRQQAVAAHAGARAALARNPTPSGNNLLSEGERLIRSGGASLQARQYAAAVSSFQEATRLMSQVFSGIGSANPGPVDLSQAMADATIRRRQEEIDRRRLRQAEELMYRVRSFSAQSRNAALRTQAERMQENLMRVRQGLDTSPTSRFTNDLSLKLSDQIRPLLDETIAEGRRALAAYEAERRSERDLDQTRGRVRRAREKLAETPSAEARLLLERADELARQSQAAGARGDYIEARVLLNSAERLIARAIELDRTERRQGPARARTREATETGAEAARGLAQLRARMRTAVGRLGDTGDPVSARLLLVAESNLGRAEALYDRGEPEECLRLLKLVGRLLQEAYDREG